MSETYEFIDGSSKQDVNTLVVDFSFTSDVTKDEAIQMVDKMVSMLDNSTDATAKEFVSHKPTLFAKSPYLEEVDDE